MGNTAIYHKTAKGQQAIASREHGLGPRQRSMLILIDGKRGFDDLAKLGDPTQILEQLLADGFIEPVGPPGATAAGPATGAAMLPPVAPPRPPATPAQPGAAGVSLADAKRIAVRKLTDLIGPNAEELCIRIESAKTAADFLAAVARAQGALQNFGGTDLVNKFLSGIQPPAG